jgi:hypothetical protein
MATFNKFNSFTQYLAEGVVNLNSDTLKIGLTNSAPSASNTIWSNITEISAGNGYTAGGATVASASVGTSAGTAYLVGNAVTFAASGGSVGPFRYAVLYDSTPSSPSKPLIGWWDYGSSITLSAGESFEVAADTSGDNWTSGTPLLSLT